MLPDKLLEIKDFLISEKIALSTKFQDGRVNASINEDEILKKINKNFQIHNPPPRYWFDFAIPLESGENIPVNIKVSSTSTNDNVQCKLGIYYALTGLWPDFPNEIAWGEYFRKLRKNLSSAKNKDYYFLIVSKKNPTDIFCTSLKQINTLVANGNNLPFQCNWGNNRDLCRREHDDAVRFLLGKFYESIQLRANILSEFENSFGDCI